MGSKRRARSARLDSQALGTATALLAPAGLGRPINAAHRCSGARHRHACRALAHTLVHRGEGPGCAPAFGPARAPDSSAARPGKRRRSAPLVRAHRHAAPVSDPVGTRTAAARSRPALCLHLPARISSVCSGAASTRIMQAMPQSVPCVAWLRDAGAVVLASYRLHASGRPPGIWVPTNASGTVASATA